jgi:hypothetical protein
MKDQHFEAQSQHAEILPRMQGMSYDGFLNSGWGI